MRAPSGLEVRVACQRIHPEVGVFGDRRPELYRLDEPASIA
jgi:hypothetical protein